MKKVNLLLGAVAVILWSAAVQVPAGCSGVGWSPPDALVSEDAGFVRIWLTRHETNSVLSVDYQTVDGSVNGMSRPATAGQHYVACSGILTFAVGQSAARIDIPLIDNGVPDGFKDFSLVVSNAPPALDRNFYWIRIQDNELSSAVDPLFVPDVQTIDRVQPLTDGRVLLAGPGLSLDLLQTNGWVDRSFGRNVAADAPNRWLQPLQVLSDGRTLALARGPNESLQQILRLRANGELDAALTISGLGQFVGVQPDDHLLVLVTNASNVTFLKRLLPDGLSDPAFSPWRVPHNGAQFTVQPDGKILLLAQEGAGTTLTRLNGDGSADHSFSAPHLDFPVSSLLLRRNGQIIVGLNGTVAQLNPDGSVDPNFHLGPVPGFGAAFPDLELPDKRLLALVDYDWLQNRIVRWNLDGTIDQTFVSRVEGGRGPFCGDLPMYLTQNGGEAYVLGGGLSGVDGMPRRRLARLLPDPPEKDFRVLTPAEAFRGSGVAHVRIVRTGVTTNGASVTFATRDGSARAGVDYATRAGRLDFAPLEVSKEVVIPLLSNAPLNDRLSFQLDLNEPSPGYSTIAATPIVIRPDLKIGTDSPAHRSEGVQHIILRGPLPRRWYSLETSLDLQNWEPIAGVQSVETVVTFEAVASRTPQRYFRVQEQ